MQETTFNYEILIYDDCSTDDTVAIIEEFQAQHPDRFKTIFQTENQYSKGVRGIVGRFLVPLASGQYIALCEGDDYWTDPQKLQKQVDFLEQHPDFSFVCGGFIEKNTLTNTERKVIKKPIKPEQYIVLGAWEITFEDMKLDWVTKTLTSVFRKESFDLKEMGTYEHFRDVMLFFMLMMKGRGLYITSPLGVYHVHNAGIHSGSSEFKRIRDNRIVYEEMYNHYPEHQFTSYRLFKSYLQLLAFRKEMGNRVWLLAIVKSFTLAKSWREIALVLKVLAKLPLKK